MSIDTDKKSIFITGAGSGIGAATARIFSQEGWFVGLYDINEASVETLSSELGPHTAFGPIDVADRASIDAALAHFVEKTGGRLDIMCNNAGIFTDQPFGEMDAERLDQLVRINVDGVMHGAHAAYPWLRRTPGAKLINIASAASIYGVPNEAVYSATKFFVRGLSESLALEWTQQGIGVSVIMPSYVRTPMTDNADISWIDRVGMKLTAEDVAATIYQAAHKDRLHWILPGAARFQSALVGLLSSKWQLAFGRQIFFGGKSK